MCVYNVVLVVYNVALVVVLLLFVFVVMIVIMMNYCELWLCWPISNVVMLWWLLLCDHGNGLWDDVGALIDIRFD